MDKCSYCINCENIGYTDHSDSIHKCHKANIVLSTEQFAEGCRYFEYLFNDADLKDVPVIKILSDKEFDKKSLGRVPFSEKGISDCTDCCRCCSEFECPANETRCQ